MKTKRGMHRMVIIGERFTVKLPRFLFFKFFVESLFLLFNKESREAAVFDLRYVVPAMFFNGIKENWNEFLCWRENRADFLVPVYFSIGIIEIQKTVSIKKISENEINQIWSSLVRLAKKEVWEADHHTLASSSNYYKEGNKYKLVDYGGPGLRQFIKKYRKELSEILTIQA